MSFQFDADSIFEIGVQIEKNGRMFYLESAKLASDERVETLFTNLASWENQHINLFQRLQQNLPESATDKNLFDPENEFSAYLQSAADSHVFVKNTDIEQLAAQCTTPAEALDMALTFEKDSVVYYTIMKKVVPEHLGRDQIDHLIDEELSHISILMQKKQEFSD